MIRIPPHILYPGMIFGLLGMSLTMCTILVISARSGDGAQIEHDYYERSVNWDQSRIELQNARRLDWKLAVTLDGAEQGQLIVTDSADQPVDGLLAQITLRRPQLADNISTTVLTPVSGQPGHYAFAHPPAAAGLWDLVIEGKFSEQNIRFERRHEVR